MEFTGVQKELQRYQTARNNLLLMIGFTVANILLTMMGTNLYMLFSATAPSFAFELGRYFAAELNAEGLSWLGLSVAIALLLLFFGCWYFSKRHRAALLVALILFGLDSFFLFYLMLTTGANASYIPDVLFHAWVLYYLVIGTLAWSRLRDVSPEQWDVFYEQSAAQQQAVRRALENTMQETYAGRSGIEPDAHTVPLRDDTKKGRILIAAEYAGRQISMKRSSGLTELIVDGQVYDEISGTLEASYSLFATIDGVEITGSFDAVRSHMYLSTDGLRIAKKLRLF